MSSAFRSFGIRKQQLNRWSQVTTALALSGTLTACSQKTFEQIDSAAKMQTISTSSVFSATPATAEQNGDGTGKIPVTGNPPATQPPAPPPIMYSGTEVSAVPVTFDCSTMWVGPRLAHITILRIAIQKANGQEACSFTSDFIRSKLLQNKVLDLRDVQASCPAINTTGEYSLRLDSKGGDLGTLLNFKTQSGRFFLENGSAPSVLADYNPDWLLDKTMVIAPERCDSKYSPLVVQLEAPEKASPLLLSSQDQGVLFDLLGRFADPKPHTPVRISWLRSSEYAFVALPDQNGQVLGIDQLFGDRTTGPDGRGAANGYAALAKYDGMSADGKVRLEPADGLITTADPVFAKLRLFKDLNLDGKASAAELITLDEAGVVAIDLRFDENYLETDAYGNETRYKSVIKMNDGSLRLLFDLWFKLARKR